MICKTFIYRFPKEFPISVFPFPAFLSPVTQFWTLWLMHNNSGNHEQGSVTTSAMEEGIHRLERLLFVTFMLLGYMWERKKVYFRALGILRTKPLSVNSTLIVWYVLLRILIMFFFLCAYKSSDVGTAVLPFLEIRLHYFRRWIIFQST